MFKNVRSLVPRLMLLASAVGLACSCGKLIGIEDLSSSAAPGSNAGGSTSGVGGSVNNNSMGGSGKSSGGSSGMGGAALGGSAGQSAVGGTGTGGAGVGGTGGIGGSLATGGSGGAPQSPDVTGKVIDFWRRPIPNVPVTIGATAVVTDANGVFTVADVAATYDASLTISTSVNNSAATFGWLYQGLTRRDPTLQVYRAFPSQNGELDMTASNVSFPLPSTRKLPISFASPDGAFGTTLDGMALNYLSGAWTGPDSTVGKAHALLFDFSGPQNLPTQYLAYDEKPVTLGAAPGSVAFDLMSEVIAVGSVTGTVTRATADAPENTVFVHFTDGAAIEVAQDDAPTANFSYVVPTIPNAGILVAAATGSSYTPPYAVAYRDDLVGGQAAIALNVPAPPALLGPVANATGVGPNTMFQWSGGQQVFLFSVSFVNSYGAMFVVTSAKQTKLPAFPATSFSIPAGEPCDWSVETHGTFTTLDEAAGPEGMLDTLSNGEPRGPRRGAGVYTESEHRGFTAQ